MIMKYQKKDLPIIIVRLNIRKFWSKWFKFSIIHKKIIYIKPHHFRARKKIKGKGSFNNNILGRH